MPTHARALPGGLGGIVDPILERLGPLAPAEHAMRLRRALAELPVDGALAAGIEVVLPPHPPACDLSLLMPPGVAPPFAEARHEPLRVLAQVAEGDLDTVWWEYDCSSDDPPVGAFLRQRPGGGQVEAVREAAAGVPALDRALDALEPLIEQWAQSPGRLLGFFPDRRPLPVAAALLPIRAQWLGLLDGRVTASVDLGSPQVTHLLERCDRFSLSVGADAEGRTALSLEASFGERERAMADGRWAAVLDDPVWGEARAAAVSLLEVQGMHRFDSLPPVGVMTGIDHVKVGPGGRVKAYVGSLLLRPRSA